SIGSCQAGACKAAGAGGTSDAGSAGDNEAAGAVARSDGGASGELGTGTAGEPNSIIAGNAGRNGPHPNTTVESDPGCSCSAAGAGQRLGSAFWIAAALGLFGARRRRLDSACKRAVQH
ncbi:MAG TPA: MYXO-CTERM sorting domain-containing protein, partial [Polyangiaceae bacterium]